MKKILLSVLVLFGCVSGAVADNYNCSKVLNIGWSSWKSSNEYLFPTLADYKDSNGLALICGGFQDGSCEEGAFAVITGVHVWDNETKDDVGIYRCSTDGGNAWASVGATSLEKCKTLDGKRLITTHGNYDIYVPNSLAKVHMASQYYTSTSKDAFCYYDHGQKPGQTQPVPDPKPAPMPAPKPAPMPAPKPGENKTSCVDSRTTAEGKACCSLHESVARWDGSQCVCVGQNQEFSYDGLQGYCNVKGEENASHQCDDGVGVTISAWKVQCKASQDVLVEISKFEALCVKSDLTVGEFNETRAAVQGLVNAMCTKSDEVTVVVEEAKSVDTSASRKAILAAENVLKNIESGFKVSVWKDEEGKFNTARLASDSIAGVVLGTAGGLITSSVIKKHQIEDGFEDINCVIGGQSVAGWGDEFSVGVQ